jgi:hypothetical protein
MPVRWPTTALVFGLFREGRLSRALSLALDAPVYVFLNTCLINR